MKILIVDDEKNIRESIRRLFELEGIDSSMAVDGERGAAALAEESFDAVILDLKMPVMDGQALLEWMRSEGLRTPVVMISALGDVNDAVKALKSGANDYLIKPFSPAELILKVRAVVERRRLEDLVEAGARTDLLETGLVGSGPATRALRQLIDKVAPGEATVLITGESGTGKEVVAREIHRRSANAEGPFVAVNIGAIHETLVESELFGHEKGAFTGADARKPGLFELAERGTIFLDEIGEMQLALQVKLLRVLQERKVRRVGGVRDIPIAARIISATNRDIEAQVRSGAFREDLYYRLNVVRIEVPPLRERREDIPLLAGHCLEKIHKRTGRPLKRLDPDALDLLCAYSFPGNIRELENLIERATIISEDNRIMAADLDLNRATPGLAPPPPAKSDRHGGGAGTASEAGAASAPSADQPSGAVLPRAPEQLSSMAELERDALIRALAKWNGNRTKAAEELGISRRTILYKIKQFGL